jgi:hypothetical protein
MPRDDDERDRPQRGKPQISRADTWRLVWETYKASFPYLLVFIIAMLGATWLVTSVFLR